ncbi:MAG TPA: hypothetical protein PL076_09570 [Bacillota bacterium]|jgi:hypothetical protein|nr:hypothetical protein [Bacillota bacterium]HQJ37744.1 hypothetical protein [Bacillota bacterium]HRS21580.1 hypothetical protein [Clostridia bacterium]
MRGTKGKLICTWSPMLHGEGCSTLACGIGIGLQHFSGKKVLIVNKSNSTSHMERYVEKDIEIKYSMDNLKIFNKGIKTEHILTYATHIKKDLYMIAGSRLNRYITGENNEFDKIFLEKCLAGFDIVITDLDTGVRDDNRLYLDQADIILAVVTPNEIIIDELYDDHGVREALGYFTGEKAVAIINKLCDGWDTVGVIGRYKCRYSLSDTFGLNYDGDVLNACCTDRNFYSFLMKETKREKNVFVKQLSEICRFLIGRLCIENNAADKIRRRNIFKKFLRSSIY